MGPRVPGPWSPDPLFLPTRENVVSPSNQVTIIVSTTNKYVHISFYGTTIGLQGHVCPPKTTIIMCRHCVICADFVR